MYKHAICPSAEEISNACAKRERLHMYMNKNDIFKVLPEKEMVYKNKQLWVCNSFHLSLYLLITYLVFISGAI